MPQVAGRNDPVINIGALLHDPNPIETATHQLRHVLEHPDANGVLGPKHLLDAGPAYALQEFFRGYVTLYALTGDSAIPAALERHFLALGIKHPVELETVGWVYSLTGNPALLEMTKDASDRELQVSNEKRGIGYLVFDEMLQYDLQERFSVEHGFNFMYKLEVPIIDYL